MKPLEQTMRVICRKALEDFRQVQGRDPRKNLLAAKDLDQNKLVDVRYEQALAVYAAAEKYQKRSWKEADSQK